jgi:hypothetical protein
MGGKEDEEPEGKKRKRVREVPMMNVSSVIFLTLARIAASTDLHTNLSHSREQELWVFG